MNKMKTFHSMKELRKSLKDNKNLLKLNEIVIINNFYKNQEVCKIKYIGFEKIENDDLFKSSFTFETEMDGIVSLYI